MLHAFVKCSPLSNVLIPRPVFIGYLLLKLVNSVAFCPFFSVRVLTYTANMCCAGLRGITILKKKQLSEVKWCRI